MGRSGNAFEEGRGACILHGKVNIFFDLVSKGRYVGEVDDAVVFLIGDREGERTVSFLHGQDWDHDVVCPCVHLHVVRMVPLVMAAYNIFGFQSCALKVTCTVTCFITWSVT